MSEDEDDRFNDLAPEENDPEGHAHSELWRMIGIPGGEFAELASSALMRAWDYPDGPWWSDRFPRLCEQRGRGYAFQEIMNLLEEQVEANSSEVAPLVAIASILLADEFGRLQPSWKTMYSVAECTGFPAELQDLIRNLADGAEVDRLRALRVLRDVSRIRSKHEEVVLRVEDRTLYVNGEAHGLGRTATRIAKCAIRCHTLRGPGSSLSLKDDLPNLGRKAFERAWRDLVKKEIKSPKGLPIFTGGPSGARINPLLSATE